VDNFRVPIALLTDFGTRDYFVAAMKGTILKIAPTVQIIDITHDVAHQDVRSAAFILQACYRDFPEATVFVCVVDPGVGSSRRAIAVESANRVFVSPDNGLLSFLFDHETERAKIYELTDRSLFARDVSNTFHGRDVFAPVAAHIVAGVRVEEAGCPIIDPVRLHVPLPGRLDAEQIQGEIIHIDHFGNIVTNFLPNLLTREPIFEINGVMIKRFVAYYSEAEPGELASITGSAGFVEISCNLGSAAGVLKAKVGDKVILRNMRA